MHTKIAIGYKLYMSISNKPQPVLYKLKLANCRIDQFNWMDFDLCRDAGLANSVIVDKMIGLEGIECYASLTVVVEVALAA